MDLATIGWISMAWLLVSVAVSLAVGRMFQHGGGMTDDDLDEAAERRRVVRYLRQPRRTTLKAVKSSAPARGRVRPARSVTGTG